MKRLPGTPVLNCCKAPVGLSWRVLIKGVPEQCLKSPWCGTPSVPAAQPTASCAPPSPITSLQGTFMKSLRACATRVHISQLRKPQKDRLRGLGSVAQWQGPKSGSLLGRNHAASQLWMSTFLGFHRALFVLCQLHWMFLAVIFKKQNHTLCPFLNAKLKCDLRCLRQRPLHSANKQGTF